jgi:hypothetical protein
MACVRMALRHLQALSARAVLPHFVPWIAAGVSLALGLLFVFVRAPHPWGWEGIDHYRELGRALARGEGFPTIDRLWGYPFFLAIFYALFGDRQWIPLVVQVALNATIPLLIFVDARRTLGVATAAVAALLTGIFSFSTVYASTQTADALSTVFFVAGVVCFRVAREKQSRAWLALSGAVAGVAGIFRPNLILFPVLMVLFDAATRRQRGRVSDAIALLLPALLVWAPWPIRNYQLTGRFIPATTHGGIQLWYGSLQTGEYFERWFDNPRAQYEAPPLSYSMPGGKELVATARAVAQGRSPVSAELVYWTDRDVTPRWVHAALQPDGQVVARVPPQPGETVVYYYFDATWKGENGAVVRQWSPLAGADDPQRHVISTRHFDNLDLHDELLDIFDVSTIVRAVAWREGTFAARLDIDRDGNIGQADLDRAASLLAASIHEAKQIPSGALRAIDHNASHATLTFTDGSRLVVPRTATRTVDFDVRGADQSMATNIMRSARSFRGPPLNADAVLPHDHGRDYQLLASMDRVFWRAEPFWMDRYTALAVDNIRRSPTAFVFASARRLIRMFVVAGSDDQSRSAQFDSSRFVYRAATFASIAFAVLFGVGLVLCWRDHAPVGVYLLAIVYIPATIFILLPNMRYVVPVQPLMFIFVGRALVSLGEAAFARFDTVRR